MTLKGAVRRIEEMARRWEVELEKQARWPAGAPSSKGGQFAPENSGAGGSGSKPKINAPQYGIGGFAAAQQQYFQGLYGGEPAAPKGPPPGAKPHPQKNDKGEPVTVNYPTKASDPQTWNDPKSAATFVPGGKAPDALNGVALSSWKAPDTIEGWSKVSGQNPKIDADYPFEHSPGKNVGAGVIIREPDGRLWITRPTNGFGGYEHTWPKGTVEGGLSLQASAIKEAYEETGLKVKIVGVLGDFERTTSKARYYVAERVGGTPADMGWESQAMRLVPPSKLGKYLNRTVDKEIAEAFEGEMLLKRLEKAKGARGGKFNPDQPRWPAGSPLGGQWMKVGADGIILPPKIAGGLEGKNPAYQKKADAAHAFAQANDKVVLAATLVALDTKVKADAAAGKASSHVKWNAQLHQYVAKLVGDMAAGPKAVASADAIRGPLDLSKLTMVGAKPGGSNPGALYADGKGGTLLVKGNLKLQHGAVTAKVSDDRAKNEVLAAKLITAVGGGAPDMKLVDLKGQYGGGLGVASRMMDGVIGFNAANPAHVAAIQKDFALHAWLGNYDVLGMGYDNTVISKGTGKAVNIDPGGAILFRAQGLPKDSFGKDASEWESMRTTTAEQKAVFGKMTGSQLQESAKALATIDDATITKLVGTYGPGDAKAKADLTATLIARRDAILEKAGLKTFTMAQGVSVAQPAPTPPVPRIKDVVKPAAGSPLPTGKPAFLASTPSAVAYYGGLADKATALHAAGDLEGLKALTTNKKGGPAWPAGSPNGKMMASFHGALLADLEGKQGQAVQAVASGAATMTAGGKTWQAQNGVLNPVPASVQALSPDEVDAQFKAAYPSPGAKLPWNEDKTGSKFTTPPTGAAAVMVYALEGNLNQVKAVQMKPDWVEAKAFQANVVAAMEAKAGGAPAAPAAPAARTFTDDVQGMNTFNGGKIKAALYETNKSFMGAKVAENSVALYTAGGANAWKGQSIALMIKAAEAGEMNVLLGMTPGTKFEQALQSNLINALSTKVTAAPAGLSTSKIEALSRAAFGSPLKTMISNVAAGNVSNLTTAEMIDAALKGDTGKLLSLSPSTLSQKQFQDGLINALATTVTSAPAAAPSVSQAAAAVAQAASTAQLNAAVSAMPNFEKAKLPEGNSNAASHNQKVGVIANLAGAKHVNGLLSLNYGTNTYGKKQAQLANDALAALGSTHKVTPGQKKNSHPALVGGVVQAAAPAPAAPPKAAAPAAPAAAPKPVYKIPDAPDFMNWKGPGAGLSSKPTINEQNKTLSLEIKALGDKLDTPALKGLTFQKLDSNGQPTGTTAPISQHPSQHIKAYHADVLYAVQNPYVPPKVMSARELAKVPDLIKSVLSSVNDLPDLPTAASGKKIGRYALLGSVAGKPFDGYPPELKSPKLGNLSVKDLYSQSKANFSALTNTQQQAIRDYTGGGYQSQNNAETGKGSNMAAQTINGLKKASVPLPEGTVLSRKFTFKSDHAGNVAALASSVGSVIKDFGIISTSTNPEVWSGDVHLRIVTAAGVKGLYVANNPSGGGGSISLHPGENEIILPFGTKFYVKSVTKGGKINDKTGSWGKGNGSGVLVELVALPDIP